MTQIILNLLRLILWPKLWSILANSLFAFEKNVYFDVGCSVSWIFFKLVYCFKLEYGWFAVLCLFLLYSKQNQLYIYMFPVFFRFFSLDAQLCLLNSESLGPPRFFLPCCGLKTLSKSKLEKLKDSPHCSPFLRNHCHLLTVVQTLKKKKKPNFITCFFCFWRHGFVSGGAVNWLLLLHLG